jgi:hypothetical protein
MDRPYWGHMTLESLTIVISPFIFYKPSNFLSNQPLSVQIFFVPYSVFQYSISLALGPITIGCHIFFSYWWNVLLFPVSNGEWRSSSYN